MLISDQVCTMRQGLTLQELGLVCSPFFISTNVGIDLLALR